jgi:predicted site-specific integrase-resolvase
MPDETGTELIGSTEAIGILKIDRSTLSRWIQLGKVKPLTKLESGAFVFDAAYIRELATTLGTERASA